MARRLASHTAEYAAVIAVPQKEHCGLKMMPVFIAYTYKIVLTFLSVGALFFVPAESPLPLRSRRPTGRQASAQRHRGGIHPAQIRRRPSRTGTYGQAPPIQRIPRALYSGR